MRPCGGISGAMLTGARKIPGGISFIWPLLNESTCAGKAFPELLGRTAFLFLEKPVEVGDVVKPHL